MEARHGRIVGYVGGRVNRSSKPRTTAKSSFQAAARLRDCWKYSNAEKENGGLDASVPGLCNRGSLHQCEAVTSREGGPAVLRLHASDIGAQLTLSNCSARGLFEVNIQKHPAGGPRCWWGVCRLPLGEQQRRRLEYPRVKTHRLTFGAEAVNQAGVESKCGP